MTPLTFKLQRRIISMRQKASDKRDFMRHAWKPLLATVFCLIILFDFAIAPAYIGKTRVPADELAILVKDLDVESRHMIIEYNTRVWKPLTLSDGVGMFYLAIGSILTGVAVFGHRGKRE